MFLFLVLSLVYYISQYDIGFSKISNEIRISSLSEYMAWVKDGSKEKDANLKQLALLYLLDPDGHKLAACGRFSISTGAMPGEALCWDAFRSWKINTQLCDLPRSIQFYVPFWGQITKIKSHNPLIFNELKEKASPAFALIL